MIKQCTCKHEFQDKRFGKNMRVHNGMGKGGTGTEGWKCTVCGTKKTK